MRLQISFIFCLSLLHPACGRDEADPDVMMRGGEANAALDLATPAELQKGEAIAGSYIVAFRDAGASKLATFRSYQSEHRALQQPLSARFLSEPAIRAMNYITSLNLNLMAELAELRPFPLPSALRWAWTAKEHNNQPAAITQVEFRSPAEAAATLKTWHERGIIWYAEANRVSKLSQAGNSFDAIAKTYQGLPESDRNWHKQVKLVEAYKVLSALNVSIDEAPLIAVMDSGTDYNHPALKNRIFENSGVGGAGCLDDLNGCDTTQSGGDYLGSGNVYPQGASGPGVPCPTATGKSEACLHGTHVAGLVAAEPQAGERYAGGCPVCQIVTVRIVGKTRLNKDASDDAILDSSIIAGFTYISRFKVGGKTAVRVVNGSFGKFQRSRTVGLLIRLLRSAGQGTLVIAAAGNEDTMKRQYPGAFDDVIAVSNISYESAAKHYTSNFGRWVDIAAPGSGEGTGVGLLSTLPGGSSGLLLGTSMASPVVAGIAGLLLAMNPNMSYEELRNRLLSTADPRIYDVEDNNAYFPLVDADPNPVPLLGRGLIDAAAALEYRQPLKTVEARSLNRVTAGCGVVQNTASQRWQLSFLALPLLGLFVGPVARRRWRRQDHQGNCSKVLRVWS